MSLSCCLADQGTQVFNSDRRPVQPNGGSTLRRIFGPYIAIVCLIFVTTDAAYQQSIALALSVAPAARSQGNDQIPGPKASIQRDRDEAIRVTVTLVSVPVVVSDTKGELVLDLEKKDFHVLDNGVEQSIQTLDLGGEALSIVLVFETSSRISPLLTAVQKSGIIFTQALIGPSGEAAVLGYDDSVVRLLPFSTDQVQIEKAIGNLKIGNSGTRPYDALDAAVRLLRDRPPAHRHVIVIVGEGRDTGSDARLGEVLREAQLSNTVIYTVGISTTVAVLHSLAHDNGGIDLIPVAEWVVRNSKAVVKGRPLEIATAGTGGLYQSTFRGHSIESAIDAIGGELNSQYTLTYRPAGSNAVGYHKISVIVDRRGARVRTRPGYYLAAD